MEINQEVYDILKEFKINKSEGILCLLGIYYKLDVEKTCSEETIKAINLTKILSKDYGSGGVITWNVPLFQGQQTEWDWVTKYNDMWNINRERKDSNPDVLRRMQEWFKKYPYRKEDVQRATIAYFKTVKDVQYLKSSAKFIFEGIGGSKKSDLLKWCEQTASKQVESTFKGTIGK